MTTTDQTAAKPLRASDDDLLRDLREPGPFGRMQLAARYGTRWTTIYVMVMSVVLTIVAVWCAVRFFGATETREMIAWATGFLASLLMVAMLKLWFWIQMEKYILLREIMRLQRQIAQR